MKNFKKLSAIILFMLISVNGKIAAYIYAFQNVSSPIIRLRIRAEDELSNWHMLRQGERHEFSITGCLIDVEVSVFIRRGQWRPTEVIRT